MRVMFCARAIHQMAGGVERMITTIMNGLVDRGHEVGLFTWDLEGAEPFFPLSPRITWHRLDMGDPAHTADWWLVAKRAARVRELVRQRDPQVIVCFQAGPFMALRLYTAGLDIPVVAAERNAPTRFEHTTHGRFGPRTVFNALRTARLIVVQRESYRALYPEYLHDRIVTVPNPVEPAARCASPDLPDGCGRFQMLCVGRLSFQKNQEALVSAFFELAGRWPDWDLVLVGEGEDQPRLEAMIRAADQGFRVHLTGTMVDPGPTYAKSHLFCLPSRWEGFPNALAEAHAHGLPAVAYAGCAGANELVCDGVNGLLAAGNGDVDSLAAALETLMADPRQRRAMGAAGRDSVAPFAPGRVMDLWEQTLLCCAGR